MMKTTSVKSFRIDDEMIITAWSAMIRGNGRVHAPAAVIHNSGPRRMAKAPFDDPGCPWAQTVASGVQNRS